MKSLLFACVLELFCAGMMAAPAVPKELLDSFKDLDRSLPADIQKELRQSKDLDEAVSKMHFTIGMHLRNSKGLWSGSELAKFFNRLGIFHPDDMSSILLTCYGRRLRGEPMDLEGQVAFYKDYWEQVAEPTDKACPEDGTELHVLMTEESEHVVHFARCKRGHWWRFDKKGEARWIRIGEPLASKLTKQFKGVWE